MKRKRTIMYIGIIILILIIIGMGYLIYINVHYNDEEIEEYTPAEELSDEQIRKTIVDLYFINKSTNELEIEERGIDSKDLLVNPYKCLIELLIQGPQDENKWNIFPENSIVKGAEIKNKTVEIELSNEFIDEVQKEKAVESIEKTLKQLNEVEKVNIIIKNKSK